MPISGVCITSAGWEAPNAPPQAIHRFRPPAFKWLIVSGYSELKSEIRGTLKNGGIYFAWKYPDHNCRSIKVTTTENRIYIRGEFRESLGMNFFSPFQPEREFKVYNQEVI